MERSYEDVRAKRPVGTEKQGPRCEGCGRPVKITREDILRDEILCPTCASDMRLSFTHEEERNPYYS